MLIGTIHRERKGTTAKSASQSQPPQLRPPEVIHKHDQCCLSTVPWLEPRLKSKDGLLRRKCHFLFQGNSRQAVPPFPTQRYSSLLGSNQEALNNHKRHRYRTQASWQPRGAGPFPQDQLIQIPFLHILVTSKVFAQNPTLSEVKQFCFEKFWDDFPSAAMQEFPHCLLTQEVSHYL